NDVLFDLLSIEPIDILFFPSSNNLHDCVLTRVFEMGAGFRCASTGEIRRVRARFPKITPRRILYFPENAPMEEYRTALDLGVVQMVVPFSAVARRPEIFRGKDTSICLNLKGLDSGESRFPAPSCLDNSLPAILLKNFEIRRPGIHLEISGLLQDEIAISKTRRLPGDLSASLPEIMVLSVGDSKGVAQKDHPEGVKVEMLSRYLDEVRDVFPQAELWFAPGPRFLVEAGVLLTRFEAARGEGAGRDTGAIRGMGIDDILKMQDMGQHVVNLSRLDIPRRVVPNTGGRNRGGIRKPLAIVDRCRRGMF
ncbi:MAG: hypothetical protein JRJ85_11250, partial [Deltaproteobacteria bacterium]|nr:hypothetical protein [Deltaproteobacteria bacterium]